MQVKNELYVFHFGDPVEVKTFGNLTDSYRLIETKFDNLPYSAHLEWFCVTNLANKSIILTGGRDKLDGKSAKTFIIDLHTGKW